MNGGVAIFMLIASQCIGYGFAGLLYEICVKPSQALWPSKIPVASVFQALHLEGLGSKRTRFYWYLFTFMFVVSFFAQSAPGLHSSEAMVVRDPSAVDLPLAWRIVHRLSH